MATGSKGPEVLTGKAIVFIWDEFSSYFKNNRTTLDEFQKLAELSNEKPFYLMIVTHMSGSLVDEGNQAFKIVRDRFIRREIEMPDSVAFDLIGHALKVRPAAQDEWVGLSDDLNSRMTLKLIFLNININKFYFFGGFYL